MNARQKPPQDHDSDSPFTEPVLVPIEDSIDLHAFSPKEIPSVVEEYIEQCVQAGIYEVRIIHGRGTGVQRRIVQSLLARLRGFGGCRARKWLKNQPVGLQGLHYKAVAEVA